MTAFSHRTRINPQTGAFILALGLLAFGGIAIFYYATPEGLALNDDSIAYIAGARSLLDGQGYREAWLRSNEPMTHWPPGFPGMLAFIGWLMKIDPLRAARALNGALFGLNSILMACLAWRMTRSRLGGILASALFILNVSLFEIHINAMSEPLYVFLTLLAFLTFDLYFDKKKIPWLLSTGVLVGLAYLSRYAAVSLLATLLVILFIFHEKWKKRVVDAVLLLMSALPFILLWSYRNYAVTGSAANRNLAWHPIGLDNWRLGVETVFAFLMPVAPWRLSLLKVPLLAEGCIFGLFAILLVWVLRAGLPRLLVPQRTKRPVSLPFFNGLYIFGYLSVLITTMTLFDPATKFQVRIISPVYASLILLLISFIAWVFKKQATIGKNLVLVLVAFLLGLSAYSQYSFASRVGRSGYKFASPNWYAAESIEYLRALPEEIIVYSNEAGVVYLYTGRPANVIPKAQQGIQTMRKKVRKGDAVIALFRVNDVDEETLVFYYWVLGRKLYQEDFSRDWIFVSPKNRRKQ
jgi:4-amino-4-deoxy-L-arabinose transferase-like glycosyltransferase